MPVYTYKCTDCTHKFDARQRFTDKPLTICPQCSGRLRKVITPVGVVFKGSGFYVTDNRNGRANGAVSGSTKNNTDQTNESAEKSDNKDTSPKSPEKVSSSNSPTKSSAASAA